MLNYIWPCELKLELAYRTWIEDTGEIYWKDGNLEELLVTGFPTVDFFEEGTDFISSSIELLTSSFNWFSIF